MRGRWPLAFRARLGSGRTGVLLLLSRPMPGVSAHKQWERTYASRMMRFYAQVTLGV